MSDPVPRVVLDTNVCLDLFVFGDPRVAPLMAALQAGQLHAVSNAECRGEWLRVLHYPQLRLDERARDAALGAFDALVHCLPHEIAPARAGASLPRCKDPDDQKFLQLALAADARWLLSRDSHVLALGRRTRRDGLFEIASPHGWVPT